MEADKVISFSFVSKTAPVVARVQVVLPAGMPSDECCNAVAAEVVAALVFERYEVTCGRPVLDALKPASVRRAA